MFLAQKQHAPYESVMKSEFDWAGGTIFSNPPTNLSAKAVLLSSIFISPLSIFGAHRKISHENRTVDSGSNGWVSAIKRIVTSGSMRRITEHVFGFNKSHNISSSSDIWLLGVCYKISVEVEDSTAGGDPENNSAFASFVEDFSSRISVTYRTGFDPLADSKYTSDAGWGCMLRSSQMLAAQALIVHRLGRSWRKSMNKVGMYVLGVATRKLIVIILPSCNYLSIRRNQFSLSTIFCMLGKHMV